VCRLAEFDVWVLAPKGNAVKHFYAAAIVVC
jgi:hypothetical protein